MPATHGEVVKAAQDVSFEVPEGKLFTLLGPSGCGKTTTLRSIAGLEKPTSGEIEVAGRAVYSSSRGIFVAPNKRNFGMVFQSYAIWPHMDVFHNVAFPLEVRRLGKREIEHKVMRVLTAVQLDHLVERDATKLSGGQQQRLALARALVMEPQLLLLDEPLSNLDAKLRDAMRTELKRLQREFNLTTVYVTHDQSEALSLSHEIAVMSDGRIVQIGTPRAIYEQPTNRFVADFVGQTNFVAGTVTALDGAGRCRVRTGLGELKVLAADGLAPDAAVVVSVRPEDVELSEQELQGRRRRECHPGHRACQGFPWRISGFSGQGRRCCAAGAGAPLAAHPDRRADLCAHARGEMRRHPDRCRPARHSVGWPTRSNVNETKRKTRRNSKDCKEHLNGQERTRLR